MKFFDLVTSDAVPDGAVLVVNRRADGAIEAVTNWQPHPLVVIKPGDILSTWCRHQMDRTDHLYTGNRLICLACHPEMDPRKAADNGIHETD